MAEEEKRSIIFPDQAEEQLNFEHFMVGTKSKPIQKIKKNDLVQMLTITAGLVETVAGGATEANAVVLAPGPTGQIRKMEKVIGWFKNATGAAWEAPLKYDNTNFWTGTAWKLGSSVPFPLQQGVNVVKPNTEIPTNIAVIKHAEPALSTVDISPQLFDKENDFIQVATMTPTTNIQPSNHGFLIRIPSDVLPVGTNFAFKGAYAAPSGSAKVLFLDSSNQRVSAIATVAGTNDRQVTGVVPVGTVNTYFHAGYFENAHQQELRNNPVINSVMLVKGTTPMDYQKYGDGILKPAKLPRYNEFTEVVDDKLLIKVPEKNIADPSKIRWALRYSQTFKNFVSSAGSQYIDSGYIPVIEGESYVISNATGTLPNNLTYTGGYFAGDVTTAVDNILFKALASGARVFTVPTGSGITGVHLNFVRTGTLVTDQNIIGIFQLEKGTAGTEVKPYKLIKIFNPLYMVSNSADLPVSQSDLPAPTFNLNAPNFIQHFTQKDKDVAVVLIGTSLMTNLYTLARTDITSRPPLLGHYNFASYLWDKLSARWKGQQYRRYDYTKDGSMFFTKTGTFYVVPGLVEWDDYDRRYGWTEYSDTPNASVSWIVPAEAWQNNFIYRTALNGGDCTVSILQGNGLMQVWNGTAWVEANGFVFTMKEPPVTLTKGNTTFQKRLKFRCKSATINSIGTAKNITITNNGSGRFMWWGGEWSPREFMLSLLDAALGSFAWRDPNEELSLISHQDNDIYPFNPDLLVAEVTEINLGAYTFSVIPSRTPSFYTNIHEEWIFNASNPLSMKAKTGNFSSIEVLFFLSTPSINGDGFDPVTGDEKFAINSAGKAQSIIDNWDFASGYMKSKGVNYIDMFSYFREYSISTYGSLYKGMVRSGDTGSTLTTDGTHYNYNGDQLVASILLPAFNFTK